MGFQSAALAFAGVVICLGVGPGAEVGAGIGFAPLVVDEVRDPANGPDAVAIEGFLGGQPPDDIQLTSRLFRPSLTFRMRVATPATADMSTLMELCVRGVSERAIVFTHVMSCRSELLIVHPRAVECGTMDEHPDAASTAAAILANKRLEAVDRGAIDAPGFVPKGLFAVPTDARAIDILARRPFDATVSDPDHCRLILAPTAPDARPATTDVEVVELRADLPAALILFDVDDELVAVIVAFSGHDADSARWVLSRGYDMGGAEARDHILGAIYDIRFP